MPRQRDAHVRRLFQSDGYTSIGWIDEDEIKAMLHRGQVRVCIDKRTGRELGFQLIADRATQALLPFSRPTRFDDRFRYEVPHAGDCRKACLRRFSLRRAIVDGKQILVRRKIKVSARKIDFTSASYRATPRGANLPNWNVSSALNSAVQAV